MPFRYSFLFILLFVHLFFLHLFLTFLFKWLFKNCWTATLRRALPFAIICLRSARTPRWWVLLSVLCFALFCVDGLFYLFYFFFIFILIFIFLSVVVLFSSCHHYFFFLMFLFVFFFFFFFFHSFLFFFFSLTHQRTSARNVGPPMVRVKRCLRCSSLIYPPSPSFPHPPPPPCL